MGRWVASWRSLTEKLSTDILRMGVVWGLDLERFLEAQHLANGGIGGIPRRIWSSSGYT